MEIENENIDKVPNEEVVEKKEVTESNPKDEIVDKTDESEDTSFDPSAFSNVPTPNEVVEEGKEIPKAEEESDDDGLDWVTDNDDTPEDKVEDKPVDKVEDKPADVVDTDSNDNVPTDNYKSFAEGLGIDTEKYGDAESLKAHMIELEEENNKLRTASGSGATNDAIKNLEGLLSKDDEALVRLSLEKDGFSGDDLDNAVDRYVDNGLIDIEAKKIRNTIDNAIVNEQNNITQSTVDADAKQQQEHAESVRKLEEHIGKTDTMFGFKMAKDEASLEQVQQGHAKYITSGKFMDDVFANDESLAEAAWFVRNKKVIISAIANKNLQKGKRAILDDIREPDVVSPQRFRDPSGSDEFDPKKWAAS
jgi:hypothetical protein